MQPTNAEEFARLAQELQLVSDGDLDAAWTELGGHNVSAEDLGNLLLRREVVTGQARDQPAPPLDEHRVAAVARLEVREETRRGLGEPVVVYRDQRHRMICA